MTIETKAFGRVDVDDRQLIHFPVGVFGFESLHDYALLDSGTPPFYWLQSLAQVQTAFVLINPYVLRPDYLLDVPEDDLRAVEYDSEEDLLVFAIVTIPENPEEMTANLQGPVIINRVKRLGRQSISLGANWKTKHGIIDELSRAGSEG
jgi:flagellar assembly factor FliW